LTKQQAASPWSSKAQSRSRGRRRAIVALALVAVAWPIRAVAANDGVAVELSFAGCAETLRPEVERITRVELHAAGSGGAPTSIEVACEGEDVELRVDDRLTGKQVTRTVSFSRIAASARARLLALAIAELVRSSWMELEVPSPPVLPIVPAVAVSAEEKTRARALVAVSPASPWRGRAGIEALELPSVGAPLFGVSLGVTRDFGRLLHAGGEASASDGVAKRTTGTVGIRMVAIEPRIGLEVGPLDVDLGARVAWVSLAGTSAASGFHGAAISGFVGGAEVLAGTRIAGPLRWWVRGGWLVQGERGIVSRDDDVTVGGGYVGLGLGVRLPR
jgi:hypothetical protein